MEPILPFYKYYWKNSWKLVIYFTIPTLLIAYFAIARYFGDIDTFRFWFWFMVFINAVRFFGMLIDYNKNYKPKTK